MFRISYTVAYLSKSSSGGIVLKCTGKIENRIDDVLVMIDQQNNCQITYKDLNWRENTNINVWGDMYSDYSVKNVLPEYIETTIKTERQYIFWKKTITKTIVKDGIIRLNKPVVAVTVKSNNWYIEMNQQQINENEYIHPNIIQNL